jgi:hypothetical protein
VLASDFARIPELLARMRAPDEEPEPIVVAAEAERVLAEAVQLGLF